MGHGRPDRGPRREALLALLVVGAAALAWLLVSRSPESPLPSDVRERRAPPAAPPVSASPGATGPAVGPSTDGLRVRVTAREGGAPVGGATVSVAAVSAASDAVGYPLATDAGATATSDAAGIASLSRPPGDAWVVARAAGFAPAHRRRRAGESEVEVALDRETGIQGELLDRRGRPVPGVPLRARPAGAISLRITDAWGLSSPLDAEAVTDDAGRFSFEGLAPIPHLLASASEDWVVYGDARVEPGAAGRVMRARPVRLVRFRLVDDETGDEVHPVFHDETATGRGPDGASTSVRTRRVLGFGADPSPQTPGSVLRYARAVFPSVHVLLVGEPGPDGVPSEADVPGEISLLLLDVGDDRPIAGLVRVERPSDLAGASAARGPGRAVVGTLRARRARADGRAELVARCDPLRTEGWCAVSLEADRPQMRLDPDVRRVWSYGEPLGDGRWRFSGLPTGTWLASVVGGGPVSRPQEVTLAPGGRVEIEVEGAHGPTGARVHVADPAGSRVYGFVLAYEGSAETTGADGLPSRLMSSGMAPTAVSIPPLGEDGVPGVGFLPLSPGSYTLRVTAPDRSRATAQATIVEGEVADVRLVLEPVPR